MGDEMLDIGWSELLIIGVVALIVVGPEELPQLLRTVGQWVGKARRMAGEFQNQMNEAIREADLEDVKKSVDDLRALNPASMIRNEISALAAPVTAVEAEAKAELAKIGSDASAAVVDETGMVHTATPTPLVPTPLVDEASAVAAIDASVPAVEAEPELPLFGTPAAPVAEPAQTAEAPAHDDRPAPHADTTLKA